MDELEVLNSRDVTTNETSVLHCGLMVKYWSIKLQIAELVDQNARSAGDGGRGDIEIASRHLAEWEKRKASAWEKRKLDELPRLMAKVEELHSATSVLQQLE